MKLCCISLTAEVKSTSKYKKEKFICKVKIYINSVSQQSTIPEIGNIMSLHTNSYYNGNFKKKI